VPIVRPLPLALDDESMAEVQTVAASLPPKSRGPFLVELARQLRGCEIGPGAVRRAARAIAQRLANGSSATVTASAKFDRISRK
jgi:hypothetical protein